MPLMEPPEQISSLLECLRLGELWSQNDLTAWLLLLAAIVAGWVAGRATTWALGRVARRCQSRGWAGRAQIALDLVGPASLAMLTLGLGTGLIALQMEEPVWLFAWKTVWLLAIIVVFWFACNLVNVIGLVVRRVRRGADSARDSQVVVLISRSLRVFLVFLGALYVAQSVFGKDIGAWLAGLGIAGLAVSLAAQDSLKNLFGSLTILLDRSFHIGDSIIFAPHEGTIEDIGFRSTTIRTPGGHTVTIPNSNLVNSPIENLSRRPAIRRVITLPIVGRTPSEKLRQAITALGNLFDEEPIRGPVRPRIDNLERPPRVLLEDIQAGQFRITVTYWYAPPTDPDYPAHAERVNLRIAEELERAGVELAQPLLKS
jgi:MscS family membrane protein